MTATSVQLTESLQALIDSRLDTIDRLLLGSVARQDRLAIVKDVETQIYELLQDRETEELDRDDVLAVLGRLDPPEAYLSEETRRQPVAVRGPRGVVRLERDEDPRIARLSGIVGLIALALVLIVAPLMFALAVALESGLGEFGIFGAVILSFVSSVVGLVLAIVSRRSGYWAVVGMVSSVAGLFVSFGAGVFLMLQVLR